MSFSFKSLGHIVATVAADVVSVSKKVGAVLINVQHSAATVEALTALVCPQAVEIERAAYFALGSLIDALDKSGTAVAANGVNVPLDADAIASLKSLTAVIKNEIAKKGLVVPPTA